MAGLCRKRPSHLDGVPVCPGQIAKLSSPLPPEDPDGEKSKA
jgi:hypothetical protein